VTFSKAKNLHQAVQSIPLSKMVLETDCPFLTPEPYRGKRNEPAMVAFTARKVAALRDEDISQVWLQAGRNAQEFFGLG
jgi:TatD DNase family protein